MKDVFVILVKTDIVGSLKKGNTALKAQVWDNISGERVK
jgi:hypothetical protein